MRRSGGRGERGGGAARVLRAAASEDVRVGCDLEPGENPLYFSISSFKVGRNLGARNREDLTKGQEISIKGIDFWAEVC